MCYHNGLEYSEGLITSLPETTREICDKTEHKDQKIRWRLRKIHTIR